MASLRTPVASIARGDSSSNSAVQSSQRMTDYGVSISTASLDDSLCFDFVPPSPVAGDVFADDPDEVTSGVRGGSIGASRGSRITEEGGGWGVSPECGVSNTCLASRYSRLVDGDLRARTNDGRGAEEGMVAQRLEPIRTRTDGACTTSGSERVKRGIPERRGGRRSGGGSELGNSAGPAAEERAMGSISSGGRSTSAKCTHRQCPTCGALPESVTLANLHSSALSATVEIESENNSPSSLLNHRRVFSDVSFSAHPKAVLSAPTETQSSKTSSKSSGTYLVKGGVKDSQGRVDGQAGRGNEVNAPAHSQRKKHWAGCLLKCFCAGKTSVLDEDGPGEPSAIGHESLKGSSCPRSPVLKGEKPSPTNVDPSIDRSVRSSRSRNKSLGEPGYLRRQKFMVQMIESSMDAKN